MIGGIFSKCESDNIFPQTSTVKAPVFGTLNGAISNFQT